MVTHVTVMLTYVPTHYPVDDYSCFDNYPWMIIRFVGSINSVKCYSGALYLEYGCYFDTHKYNMKYGALYLENGRF